MSKRNVSIARDTRKAQEELVLEGSCSGGVTLRRRTVVMPTEWGGIVPTEVFLEESARIVVETLERGIPRTGVSGTRQRQT